MSRPTLYRRLAAIEQILGADLGDPESMMSLYVAMLIRDASRGGALIGRERR
jgi:purine catabolism regulator